MFAFAISIPVDVWSPFDIVVNDGQTMSMTIKISDHLYDHEVKGQDQIFFKICLTAR